MLRRGDSVKRMIAVGSLLALALLAGAPRPRLSNRRPSPAPSQAPHIDDTMEAGEGEAEAPRRRMVSFNEYDGPIGTIRVGFGFLSDYVAYGQDANSKEQFPDLSPQWKMRDSRILFHGSLQDQAADQLERRRHVRLVRREVGDAADARDHRRPGNLGAYRRWPDQRRLLDEQGHDRIWGLDHGAPAHQRRDPAHPR